MALFERITTAASTASRVASAAWDAAVSAMGDDTPRVVLASAGDVRDPVAIPAPYMERDPAILGNRLTPERLATIVRTRNEGHLQPWVDLGTEFLSGKNPHLLSQLSVRRTSVTETRFAVRAGDGSNQQGARRAVKDFEALVARWKARQEWELVLGQVVMAEWWGRSLHELLWSEEQGFITPERAVWVHPRRHSYACAMGDSDPWSLRLHDPDDPSSPFSGPYGKPLSLWHADKFVVHETAPLGVHRTGEGLFAGVVWFLLLYEWDLRDLMALIELLGRPAHIGYYAAGGAKAAQPAPGVSNFNGARMASPEEVQAIHRAVTQVSGALRVALPDTTRIEALQYGDRSSPLQLEVAKHIEALLSKAINGTTGVTDIVAGSRAAQQVAWQQSLTFWRYDVRRVCGWLGDLARRMVAANPRRYGLGCPAPVVFSPDLEPLNDNAAGNTPAKDAA